MVTRLLNPDLHTADLPADRSEPAHVEIHNCVSDISSVVNQEHPSDPYGTACRQRTQRAQPVALAAIQTEGWQPWYTMEEGAVWASFVTNITTINPSAAAVCTQLQRVSRTAYSWAAAPKARLIGAFKIPGLCGILTSSLMPQWQSLYFFLFWKKIKIKKSEWLRLSLIIQFYLYLASYCCPCKGHHHSHWFWLEMKSLQHLSSQNGILHHWNIYSGKLIKVRLTSFLSTSKFQINNEDLFQYFHWLIKSNPE